MSDKPSFETRPNGPLIAKNVTRMSDADGNAVETKPVMALCRCGASKNKPFCDGTHNEIGFEDGPGKAAGPDRIFSYEGGDVVVTFNPRLCGHAAECGRIAPDVFNTAQKPWVQPDKGTLDQAMAVAAACPSGALRAAKAGEAVTHTYAKDVEVHVQEHGPYWVRDVSPPADPTAEESTPRKYVLCRCGKSGAKPFCDGTHRDAGWRDS